jgi:hypothetical protein
MDGTPRAEAIREDLNTQTLAAYAAEARRLQAEGDHALGVVWISHSALRATAARTES